MGGHADCRRPRGTWSCRPGCSSSPTALLPRYSQVIRGQVLTNFGKDPAGAADRPKWPSDQQQRGLALVFVRASVKRRVTLAARGAAHDRRGGRGGEGVVAAPPELETAEPCGAGHRHGLDVRIGSTWSPSTRGESASQSGHGYTGGAVWTRRPPAQPAWWDG